MSRFYFRASRKSMLKHVIHFVKKVGEIMCYITEEVVYFCQHKGSAKHKNKSSNFNLIHKTQNLQICHCKMRVFSF
jgi:hypothetical protein